MPLWASPEHEVIYKKALSFYRTAKRLKSIDDMPSREQLFQDAALAFAHLHEVGHQEGTYYHARLIQRRVKRAKTFDSGRTWDQIRVLERDSTAEALALFNMLADKGHQEALYQYAKMQLCKKDQETTSFKDLIRPLYRSGHHKGMLLYALSLRQDCAAERDEKMTILANLTKAGSLKAQLSYAQSLLYEHNPLYKDVLKSLDAKQCPQGMALYCQYVLDRYDAKDRGIILQKLLTVLKQGSLGYLRGPYKAHALDLFCESFVLQERCCPKGLEPLLTKYCTVIATLSDLGSFAAQERHAYHLLSERGVTMFSGDLAQNMKKAEELAQSLFLAGHDRAMLALATCMHQGRLLQDKDFYHVPLGHDKMVLETLRGLVLKTHHDDKRHFLKGLGATTLSLKSPQLSYRYGVALCEGKEGLSADIPRGVLELRLLCYETSPEGKACWRMALDYLDRLHTTKAPRETCCTIF